MFGIDELMPQILRTWNLLDTQGITPNKSVEYQDNQRKIIMEANIILSSGKQPHQMNVISFFLRDWVRAGELNI